MEVCNIFLNNLNTFCKESYTCMCSIAKKLCFLVKILYNVTHTMIDNKTINCITLPLHKAYPVCTVARSNLEAQKSKWLLIPISQKCSFNDLSQKLLAKF